MHTQDRLCPQSSRHVHMHTQRVHWKCKTKLHIQELEERETERGEASQRQVVSWALADVESVPICGMSRDLIQLLDEGS